MRANTKQALPRCRQAMFKSLSARLPDSNLNIRSKPEIPHVNFFVKFGMIRSTYEQIPDNGGLHIDCQRLTRTVFP